MRATLSGVLDDLTRFALVSDWPLFPLVIIDEFTGSRTEYVQSQASLRGAHYRQILPPAWGSQPRHSSFGMTNS